MKEFLKTTSKSETSSLKELFNTVPTQKETWEYLEKELTENLENIIIHFENFIYINGEYDAQRKKDALDSETKKEHILTDLTEKTLSFQKDFSNQITILNKDLLAAEEELKSELLELENSLKEELLIYNSEKDKITNDLNEESLLLKEKLKEHRRDYLKKVTTIYNNKDIEEERISTKYYEQVEDYHQKNKQRLTQNSLNVNLEDEELTKYLKLHEKDEVYAKQNYLKTITNLNDKIHFISTNYKKVEEKLEKEFNLEHDNLIKKLDEKKKEIDSLIDKLLNEYEKEYQSIDANLDIIRKKYHEEEIILKNKYNRQVTSININHHYEKELINVKISDLNSSLKDDQKEISLLKKTKHLLETNTKKDLKEAKKEYKTNFTKETKRYVSAYEMDILKRNLLENDKNNALLLYKELYTLEENQTKELIHFLKSINKTKKDIIDNYLQLEITPLESQNQLANHIYNTELKLQNLENEYVYLKTSRKKHSANLKSELHKYNLNKTKDRVQYTYNLELITSKLTNYLLMEKEKNEFVYKNKLVKLARETSLAYANKETLKVNEKIAVNELKEKHKKIFTDFSLTSIKRRKTLNTNLINDTFAYQLEKEKILKTYEGNNIINEEFTKTFKIENSYLKELIKFYSELYLYLYNDEEKILTAFFNSSLENTNKEDFNIFLSTTKKLLLLKGQVITSLILELSTFLKEHILNINKTLFIPKLAFYNNEITHYYNELANVHLNEIDILEEKITLNNEEIQNDKETILDIKEKLQYSYKTVEYTNNELEALKKLDSTKKNKKIIADLTEHVLMNKNYQHQKQRELRDARTTLKVNIDKGKKQKQSLDFAYRSVRKIRNKHKKDLKLVEKFINAQINVLNDLSTKATYLKEKYIKVNINYNNKLESAFLNEFTFKQIKDLFLNSLKEKNAYLIDFFSQLNDNLDLSFKKLKFRHSNKQEKEQKDENKSLLKLEQRYKKNSLKNSLKIKDAETEHKKSENVLLQKKISEFENLKEQNIKNLEYAEQHIKKTKDAIPLYQEEYKNHNEAFEINKHELLLKEENMIKTEYKDTLKANQKEIRETKNNIKKIKEDMDYDDKKLEAQINYHYKRDKQVRKRILHKQTVEEIYHNRQIDNLKNRIPKINLEVRYIKARSKNNESHILRDIKKNTSKITIIDKLQLKLNIINKVKTMKKEFKRSFKEKDI